MKAIYFSALIFLGSCCGTETLECPDGTRYTDFFISVRPETQMFENEQGETIQLGLTEAIENYASCVEYNECESSVPMCDVSASYTYRSSVADSIYLSVTYPYFNRVHISMSIGNESKVTTALSYLPLNLSNSGNITSMSLYGNIELGGLSYQNVYHAHVTDTSRRLRDIYFSQNEGVIQFVITKNEELVRYSKS